MKRELVVQFHGGNEHTFALDERHNEDELREFFLTAMSEKACKEGRVITWGGATFVAAWIACFWFRDVGAEQESEMVRLQRRAVQALEREVGRGEDWKGEE